MTVLFMLSPLTSSSLKKGHECDNKLNIVIFKPDLSLGGMVKSFPLYRLGTIALEPIVSFPSPST